MRKRTIKSFACIIMSIICVLGTSLSVSAERVPFDITVPGDTLSRRASKADDEQRYYVTGEQFYGNTVSNGAALKGNSIQYQNEGIYGNEFSISKNSKRSTPDYHSYARPNVSYFLRCRSNTSSSLHVLGYYTP